MFKAILCALNLTATCFAADALIPPSLPFSHTNINIMQVVENDFSAKLQEASMAWKFTPEQRSKILTSGTIFFSSKDTDHAIDDILFALGCRKPEEIQILCDQYQNSNIGELSSTKRLEIINAF